MDENELFFLYYDNNIFVYDRDNHDNLKDQHLEYVDGKIYLAPEDEQIFNAWKETNPENLYYKRAFLDYCHQPWLEKQGIFSRKEVEVFEEFYKYRVRWKRTMNC